MDPMARRLTDLGTRPGTWSTAAPAPGAASRTRLTDVAAARSTGSPEGTPAGWPRWSSSATRPAATSPPGPPPAPTQTPGGAAGGPAAEGAISLSGVLDLTARPRRPRSCGPVGALRGRHPRGGARPLRPGRPGPARPGGLPGLGRPGAAGRQVIPPEQAASLRRPRPRRRRHGRAGAASRATTSRSSTPPPPSRPSSASSSRPSPERVAARTSDQLPGTTSLRPRPVRLAGVTATCLDRAHDHRRGAPRPHPVAVPTAAGTGRVGELPADAGVGGGEAGVEGRVDRLVRRSGTGRARRAPRWCSTASCPRSSATSPTCPRAR